MSCHKKIVQIYVVHCGQMKLARACLVMSLTCGSSRGVLEGGGGEY